MKRNKLRRTADLVRAEWGAARLEAMASGRTMAFYYEPGGRQFRIDPLYYDPDLEHLANVPPLSQSSGRELRGRRVLGELPDGVLFTSDVPTHADDRVDRALDTDRVVTADGLWSQPFLFYADGSTTDGYLTLINDEDETDPVGVVMSLRGVTGSARVTPPVRISKLSL
jgi:hypothetical protein